MQMWAGAGNLQMIDQLTNDGKFGEYIIGAMGYLTDADWNLMRHRFNERCNAEANRVGMPVYPGRGSKVVVDGNRLEVIVNLTTDPFSREPGFTL